MIYKPENEVSLEDKKRELKAFIAVRFSLFRVRPRLIILMFLFV